MSRQIEIVIAVDGSIQIDAVGFTGADCEQATQFIEEALGRKTHSQRKPEYFQQRKHTRINQQGTSA